MKQREVRHRLQAAYEAQKARDEEAIAAIWGRSLDAKRDAEYVREQRCKS